MPFVKGHSGNPAGRGVGDKLFRNALLAALKRADGDVEKIQLVAEKLVANAIENRDTAAIREIADRLDGKPAQAVDVTGDDRRIIVEIRRFDRPESLGGPVIEATPADVVDEAIELPNFLKIGHKQ
jgi:hypothetical protein